MTIAEAIKSDPKIETELLLSHVLNKPKEFLYLNPEHKLSKPQALKLSGLIKRRQKGEPIAYIVGYKYFYGLKFKVTKDTLVPRPETELLVDKALSVLAKLTAVKIANKKKKIKVLDVGTGSGCIAVSLATSIHSRMQVNIIASDISKKALAVAKQNAKTHRAKVSFVLSDLLDKLVISPDLIIANLPYVSKKDKRSVAIDLKYEPSLALFTNDNGLSEIKRLLIQVSALKIKPKFVLLEFDPKQKPQLSSIIKKYLPGASIKFHRDLAKRWRVAQITI